MSAWGYGITTASGKDRDYYNSENGWGCCGPKCRAKPVLYRSRYNYVTGRSGRVGVSEKFLCQAHAEKFAKKHGLTLPPIDAPAPASAQSQRREMFQEFAQSFAKD